MLECVVNISEGRDRAILDALTDACGEDLLDVHVDPHHHRSVFTLLGEGAPRRLATTAVEILDLGRHSGVHPRIGVVDVVPFVALGPTRSDEAIAARDAFCRWAGRELRLPCFRYGPDRSLPEVRRGAFTALVPDCGPAKPHPTAGACAVGARPVLVAYNIWVSGAGLAAVRSLASEVREPRLRTLGLAVGDRLQVSCNLVAPLEVGPAEAVARTSAAAARLGITIEGTELVGLIPEAVLDVTEENRWAQLDLSPQRTIEARVRAKSR